MLVFIDCVTLLNLSHKYCPTQHWHSQYNYECKNSIGIIVAGLAQQ